MNHRISQSKYAAAIASFLSATSVFAGAITYHTDHSVIGGTGCPQDATRIYADEFGGLAIEHDAMAVSMDPYGTNTVLAERKACAIRVPMTLQRGYYIRSIEQRLTFSVSKSSGAEARIATRTSLSGLSVNPFTSILPYGDEIYSENLIEIRRDFVGGQQNRARFCQTDRPEEQMLQINIAMTAQRNSVHDELILAAAGTYVSEGFEIDVAECP